MTDYAKKIYQNFLSNKERKYFFKHRDDQPDPRYWPIGDWCPGIDSRDVYEGKADDILEEASYSGISSDEIMAILKESHKLFSDEHGGDLDYGPIAKSGKVLVPGQDQNGNTITKTADGKKAIFEADPQLLFPTKAEFIEGWCPKRLHARFETDEDRANYKEPEDA